MKTTITLFLFAVVLFAMAACATPEQTVAAVSAVGASAAALIEALAPVLPPEKLAQLQATAHNIDGTVTATATAVHTLADAIAAISAKAGTFGDAVQTKMLAFTDAVSSVTAKVAEMPSRAEVYEVGLGTGVAGTAASRVMSRIKHGTVPKPVA